MNKDHHCPFTARYLSLKESFGRAFAEKHGEKNHCALSRFKGRMDEHIFKRLKKDQQTQTSMNRGVVKNLAIMFADIRGFTRRTANMPPEKIVSMLDIFIPEMLHIIIQRHKGMVDKLLGDGIMALYGHPYGTGQEIIQAIYSAIDMQQAAAAMAQVLKISGYDPIEIGVGINIGDVLICEVGDQHYRESTIIGAPVNMAAKMEDAAGSHEIVLPIHVLSAIEILKPNMVPYFEKQESVHGEVINLDWIQYIQHEQKEVPDWKIV